jgi:hypothetical protein
MEGRMQRARSSARTVDSTWRTSAPHRPDVGTRVGSNMTNEVVERVLAEKIEHLEKRVKQLESALREAESITLESTLGPLRAREAILLYVGHGTADDCYVEVAAGMGVKVARAASQHLFVLNNAPLHSGEREALREVFKGGMSRF